MKNLKKTLVFATSILVLLSVTACTNTTTVRHSVDYGKSMQKPMKSLPASAEVHTVDVGYNKQRMHDYESFVEREISLELTKSLRDKGYNTTFTSKRDLHNKRALADYDRLRTRMHDKFDSLYKPLAKDVKEAYSITDKVKLEANWSAKFDNNLVVISKYSEEVKTGGAQARDFLIDAFVGSHHSDIAEASTLYVGIIDISSGKIVWTNMGMGIEGMFSSAFSNSDQEFAKKKISHLVKHVLEPLPHRSKLSEDMRKKAELSSN